MSKIHCVGAYQVRASVPPLAETQGFNRHPPLGVNATKQPRRRHMRLLEEFQWAPTLGGECYRKQYEAFALQEEVVSMGTHPWG